MSVENRKGKPRRAVPKTIDLVAGEVREIASAAGDAEPPVGDPAADDAARDAETAGGGERRPEPVAELAPEADATPEFHVGPDEYAAPRDTAPSRSWRRHGLVAIAAAVILGGSAWYFLAGRAPETDSTQAETLAAIDVLAGRLAEAERKLGEFAAGGGNAADARLGDAVTALEARIAAAEAKQGDRVAALERRIAAAEKSAAAPASAPDERLAALDGRLQEISARLEALERSQSAANAARAGLDEKAVAARASVATALKSAFERGEPFAQLLASAGELAGKDPAFDALGAVAVQGAPTVADLAREFAALGGAIDAALAPVPEGLVARLLANARGLVRVRPEGPVAGDGPDAVLSRIEAALAGDDVAGALSQWERLPEAAKRVADDWRRKAAARVEASAALGRALALLQ